MMRTTTRQEVVEMLGEAIERTAPRCVWEVLRDLYLDEQIELDAGRSFRRGAA